MNFSGLQASDDLCSLFPTITSQNSLTRHLKLCSFPAVQRQLCHSTKSSPLQSTQQQQQHSLFPPPPSHHPTPDHQPNMPVWNPWRVTAIVCLCLNLFVCLPLQAFLFYANRWDYKRRNPGAPFTRAALGTLFGRGAAAGATHSAEPCGRHAPREKAGV